MNSGVYLSPCGNYIVELIAGKVELIAGKYWEYCIVFDKRGSSWNYLAKSRVKAMMSSWIFLDEIK